MSVSNNLFERWAAGETAGVARLLGLKLMMLEEDRAVMGMEAGPQHTNPMGSMHGGILCDLTDAAMGLAWWSGLKDGEIFTTVELKINFFRPVVKGQLKAEAKVVRRGRRLGYVECDVHDDQARLVARAGSTCMVLEGASNVVQAEPRPTD